MWPTQIVSIDYAVPVCARSNDNNSFWNSLANRRGKRGGYSYLPQGCNLRVKGTETTKSLKINIYFNLCTRRLSIGGILLVFLNIDCDAKKARRCHIHSYFFLEFLLLLIVVNQPHLTSHACLQWLVSFSICWSLKLSVSIYLLTSKIAKNYSEEKHYPSHYMLSYYYKKLGIYV